MGLKTWNFYSAFDIDKIKFRKFAKILIIFFDSIQNLLKNMIPTFFQRESPQSDDVSTVFRNNFNDLFGKNFICLSENKWFYGVKM